MERIAQAGSAVDLLVDGTFALRRALDWRARPVAGGGEGALHPARPAGGQPPVRPEPDQVGAHAR